MRTKDLIVVAVFLGVATIGACAIWGSIAAETVWEAADRSKADLSATIDALNAGKRPPEPSSPPAIPWPADHPFLSGVIVFGVVLIIGRVYLFMRRLETR